MVIAGASIVEFGHERLVCALGKAGLLVQQVKYSVWFLVYQKMGVETRSKYFDYVFALYGKKLLHTVGL